MSGLDGPVIVAHWIGRGRSNRLMMLVIAAASFQAPQGVQLNNDVTKKEETIKQLLLD